MELMLAIIAGIAVLGLIALGIVMLILGKNEREHLHELIKSKDLTEYISVQDEPEEEEEMIDPEVDITEIPILEDSRD
jgi:hypothetical protein